MSASPPTATRDFFGGLHLADHKIESNGTAVRVLSPTGEMILPLQQQIGEPAEPVVSTGERVLKGQVIARPTDYVSATLHAPTSGVIAAIEERPIPHPSGLQATCLVLASDGKDEWAALPPAWPDFTQHDPAELRERIRWAGIVGLGGAAFPTNVKANPGVDRPIDTLVINGAECEPYITCDDRLMRERSAEVVAGAEILRHVIGAKECLIGIEDNKPEAVAAIEEALSLAGSSVTVVVVPTKYPSGGEKQLIYLLAGKEVPSNGIPADIGLVCINVATAAAVAAAVLKGRPLISRIVTVTGGGVAEPQNLDVPLGTPAAYLIDQAGGYTPAARRLILGGPMMGFALHGDHVPITKAANCLLVAGNEESPPTPMTPITRACIRCGECARVCPMQLLPQQIYWYARAKDLDKAQDYHLFDCIECGCCSYVCPSHIPLVQYYRFAKTETWAQEREKLKSELARQRHDARAARLARLEAERQSRLRKKKEALEKKSATDGKSDPKKAAIEAAMQRVAAKKAARELANNAAEPAKGQPNR